MSVNLIELTTSEMQLNEFETHSLCSPLNACTRRRLALDWLGPACRGLADCDLGLLCCATGTKADRPDVLASLEGEALLHECGHAQEASMLCTGRLSAV